MSGLLCCVRQAGLCGTILLEARADFVTACVCQQAVAALNLTGSGAANQEWSAATKLLARHSFFFALRIILHSCKGPFIHCAARHWPTQIASKRIWMCACVCVCVCVWLLSTMCLWHWCPLRKVQVLLPLVVYCVYWCWWGVLISTISHQASF